MIINNDKSLNIRLFSSTIYNEQKFMFKFKYTHMNTIALQCNKEESMIINKTIAMRFGIVNTKRLINVVLENNCKSETFRSRSNIFRQEVILE